MQLSENHSPQFDTASVYNSKGNFTLDQSGSSDDIPFQLTVGKGSLAFSPDAVLVQKRMMKHAIELLSYEAYKRLVNSPLVINMFPMFVDIAGFETTIDRQTLVDDRERVQLQNRLLASFEAEPLEDGMDHPAEQIIRNELENSENQNVLDLFRAFSLDVAHPSFAASVLRCLGRQAHLGTISWRTGLVRDALRLSDVEIRDAAIQATELWGYDEMRSVLQEHSEPELWLRDYISDVLADLGD